MTVLRDAVFADTAPVESERSPPYVPRPALANFVLNNAGFSKKLVDRGFFLRAN